MKKLGGIILLLLVSALVRADHNEFYYWVQFSDKEGTPFRLEDPLEYLSQKSIDRRDKMGIAIDSTDLPVNPLYLESVKNLGFGVKHTSRWMNGAILSSQNAIHSDSLELPSFVEYIEIRKEVALKSASQKFEEIDSLSEEYYGDAFEQIALMQGEALHQNNKGENIHIAVIDAGFKNANQLETLDSLIQSNRILGTRDFVKPGNDVYQESTHGTYVLSILAANQPGQLIGSAPKASYWLLRSEDVHTEYPIEEDYWIVAAEFADSVGCDVLNTSLGYSLFDDPKFDHSYEEFNGNTLKISKAANLAAEKGMVVVCSAGNSGREGDPWGHILAPSEAEKALSIAAVTNTGDTVSFSSWGFTSENALPKPDISAMGSGVSFSTENSTIAKGGGTSFSSPLIAGMAACLINIYPEKTAIEIMDLIRTAGNRYPNHDPKFGYGVADFSKIVEQNNVATGLKEENGVLVYPNPFKQTLRVSSEQEFSSLELYNQTGKKLFSTKISASQSQISSNELSILPKGMYFVVLKSDTKTHSVKLIKN